MTHPVSRPSILSASLLFALGFALPASADTYQTFTTPKVNGYQVGTVQPSQPSGNFSTPVDTARRFCQDQGFTGVYSFTSAVRGSAYTYVNGAGGVGAWNTTGNANVTMLETVTCYISTSDVTFTTPKVNGYQVGTIQPNYPTSNYSTPADTARRFCQDQGFTGIRSFTTAIRGSAYTYVNGTGGVGAWNTTGNANVTMLETITCSNAPVATYTTPKVNGYQVGTIQPNYPTSNYSTAADTARRFCQDLNHVDVSSFTTAIRGSAYTYVNGTGGVGAWNTTGNANVTMLEAITCVTQ
jgi:putative hemolysin